MCGRLVNLDTVARVLADYYHLKTDTQFTALNEALSRVPAETVGKELFGNSEQLDTISRQAAIDALHVMPDIKEIEKIIIDHIYIGDQKLTDLVASGRLRLVGFCEECKHCFPPLVSMVDGEVVQVTSERCSICNGYVEKNGWCYKFERRTDE